jgi:signal transduction histidine kinase
MAGGEMGQVGEVEAAEMSLGEHFRALADSIGEGVAICRGGRICWASQRMVELMGRSEARDLLGATVDSLLEDTGGGLADPAGTGPVNCRVGDPHGGMRQVRATRISGPGIASEGDEEIWVITDQTRLQFVEREILETGRALHRANRDLATLRDRLREETREREQLLTVVSHELRTPVTVISGYNKLLLSNRVGRLTEEQRRFLNESTKSCQRLNRFIQNILTAASDAHGDELLQLARASVGSTIEGVIAFFRPLAEERDLRMELALDSDALWARFDVSRIEQVLTNLLGNAIKYAKTEGEVRIETRCIEAAGLRFVEVAVADNGPGIAFEDRNRIFEPYVRGTEENRGEGLGLGLAICKRIVEAHEGSITVADRPGGGSRFAFTLPAADADPVEAN